MDLGVWLALIALFLVAGLTPGPAVMLVVTCSMRYGIAPSLIAALGVCTANVLWVALASAGAAVLSRTQPGLFSALKLVGLGFVVYLGVRMARERSVDLSRLEPPPRRRLYIEGVALQLGNPNALVFFGGMLPAYLDPERPLGIQLAIILLSVTATELAGLTIYGVGADALLRRFVSRSFAHGFFRLAAALMVAAAAFGVYATWRPDAPVSTALNGGLIVRLPAE